MTSHPSLLVRRRKELNRLTKTTSTSGDIGFDLKEREDEYLQKLDKLTKFKGRAKKENKLNQHKFDWLQEWSDLKKEETQLMEEAREAASIVISSLKHSVLNERSVLDAGCQCKEAGALEGSDEQVVCLPTVISLEKQLATQPLGLGELLSGVISRWQGLKSSLDRTKAAQGNGKTGEQDYALLANDLLVARQHIERLRHELNAPENELSDELQALKCTILRSHTNATPVRGREAELRAILAVLGELAKPSSSDHHDDAPDENTSIPQYPASDKLSEPYQVTMVRSELENRLGELLAKRERSLHECNAEWWRVCTGCSISPEDPCGGLGRADHDTFERVWKLANRRGVDRSRLMERLALELPHRSNEELGQQVSWMEALQARSVRKKDIVSCWERERSQLVKWASKAFEQARCEADTEERRAMELAQEQARSEELHRELDELRAKSEEDKRRASEERWKVEEQDRLEDERRKRKEAEEQRRRRAKVEEYHRDRQRKKVERERAERQERQKAEALRLKRDQEDRQRVTFRDRKRLEKLDSIQQVRWEAKQRELRRLRAIARIAASVPYAEAIANVQADPLKPTAATVSNVFDGQAFRRDPNSVVQGFTDQALFKDKRFKLGFALREAGVSNTAAAAVAVRKACPVAQRPYAYGD